MAIKRARCLQIWGRSSVAVTSALNLNLVRLCPPRNSIICQFFDKPVQRFHNFDRAMLASTGCQVGANVGGTAFAKLVRAIAISLRHSAAAAEASHLGVDGGVLVAGLIDPLGTIGGRSRRSCDARGPGGARRRGV